MMFVIDWGTTNLRAYLCNDDGAIVKAVESPMGIKSVAHGDYPAVLRELLKSFDGPADTDIFISGMAGSRGGWQEIPYCQAPLSIVQLVAGLKTLPAPFQGHFIPGVRGIAKDGTTDVMRGEEIQIFGALSHLNLTSAVLCLPGTHSKWVRVDDSRITEFATFMTGDVFQALGQTILKCRTDAAFWKPAFITGLDAADEIGGGLLHQLFTARTRMLDGDLTEGRVSSFVSGLLVGHELQESNMFRSAKDPVVVIGADKLCSRYRLALEYFSVPVLELGSDVATCKGVAALRNFNLKD